MRSLSVLLLHWPPSLSLLQIPFQVSSVDGGVSQRVPVRLWAESTLRSVLLACVQRNPVRRDAPVLVETQTVTGAEDDSVVVSTGWLSLYDQYERANEKCQASESEQAAQPFNG